MMSIRTFRSLTLAVALVPWLAHCDKGNNNNPPEDTGTDAPGDVITDSADDVPSDAPADTAPDTGSAWRTCAKGCSVADDCCLTGTTAACGTYPNKWVCDTVCMAAGCDDDAECVTWATGLSLPGAADYKCNPATLYYEAGYCVPGCTTADDCCPTSTDCSAFPQRRVCDDGGCELDGCISSAECVTWATDLGLADAASFVCETFDYSDSDTCAKPCSSVSDCCPSGSCGTFPNHADCIEGHCLTTCTENVECTDWAVGQLLPDPLDYVCHAF
jgi:hypothetical protein